MESEREIETLFYLLFIYSDALNLLSQYIV